MAFFFLAESSRPTADIKAQAREIDRTLSVRSIEVGDWQPGVAKTLFYGNIPVTIWRRNRHEMTTAIEQL